MVQGAVRPSLGAETPACDFYCHGQTLSQGMIQGVRIECGKNEKTAGRRLDSLPSEKRSRSDQDVL